MSGDEVRDEMSHETTSIGPQCPPLLPEEKTITRSDEVWWEDGNVVLQTSTKRYRVHRSIMAFHSSIFKDMLCVPQPVEQGVYEGCPIVHLTDLTEDWDELLPLIYNIRNLWNDHSVIDLYLMVAMLRLGNKYDCDRFKNLALEQLHRTFPATFDECKNRAEGATWDGASYHTFAKDNEFYLLDVTLDLGIETALPFAFFTCLQNCTIAKILDGSYDAGPARSGTLRSQTRQALLESNQKIINDISDQVYAWWKRAKPSTNCTTKEICTDIIRKDAIQMIGVPTLRELFVPKVGIKTMKGLCQACKNLGTKSIDNGRRQVFDKFPTFFGLPEWAALKDFQN